MMSLVPEYESSSDSDSAHSSDNEESVEEGRQQRKNEPTHSTTLPSASLLLSGLSKGAKSGHVFNNPYKQAENAKIASLETHVKMVATEEHIQVKNGKKICWNYRKGRCRFGSNCTFAHDEIELQPTTESIPTKCDEERPTFASQSTVEKKLEKKKRPGLGNSIVPSKKVMTQYYQTKSSK